MVFCGLNPSTADETDDDPTVRREIGYARDWGYGRYVNVNAYALRSTDPRALRTASDPCGPDNFKVVLEWAKRADLFVAAWGAKIRPSQAWTLRLAFDIAHVKVHALKLSRGGFPSHPLYLPKTLKPFVIWEGA